MSNPGKKVEGRAYPCGQENVDTDVIIPAHWLKTISRDGRGQGAFETIRAQDGNIFDDPEYEGASILIAGDNFGCGSSREHAAWALDDMGIKAIKFDDLNWDKNYTPNDAYSQSKLAQIMSIYDLQDRLENEGITDVKAYACHPGSSRTNLINTNGSFMMKIIFGLMKLSPLTQPAENGAYPMLMCATENDLDQSAFYGPTGKNNWTGPVGAHHLESHAKDKAVAKRLWELSEKETGVKWNL